MVHRHKNQEYLNKLGTSPNVGTYYIQYSGNNADKRSWDRERGVVRADGSSVEFTVDENTGVKTPIVQDITFSPVRVSPDGSIFQRQLSFDAAGTLIKVGPETLIAKPTGTSLFSRVGTDGFMPMPGAEVGDSDAVYEYSVKGYVPLQSPEEDAETLFMRVSEGGDIVLKLEESMSQPAAEWTAVSAAAVGPLYCNAFETRLTGKTPYALPPIDGVTPIIGLRVLLDSQPYPSENGIYVVSRLGGDDSTWELKRASDALDPVHFLHGKEVFIEKGDVRTGQRMRLVSVVEYVGTSDVIFQYVQ